MKTTQELLNIYRGYQDSSLLFKSNQVFGFEQFETNSLTFTLDGAKSFTSQRLGKLVEQFVGFQLQHQDGVELLEEQIQIQNGKQTIGELDVLLLNNDKPIHLEIVYKFYLYDTLHNYNDPLAYWIGPNRKDTLLYKLEKLKNKQFPLLYHPMSQHLLDRHHLKASEIEQQLCFKGQLFLPFEKQMSIEPLNINCVSGWHVSFTNLDDLKDYQFYIPEKLEWLMLPHLEVTWLDYTNAKDTITKLAKAERSPMCWVKGNTNEIQKCFVTWW